MKKNDCRFDCAIVAKKNRKHIAVCIEIMSYTRHILDFISFPSLSHYFRLLSLRSSLMYSVTCLLFFSTSFLCYFLLSIAISHDDNAGCLFSPSFIHFTTNTAEVKEKLRK